MHVKEGKGEQCPPPQNTCAGSLNGPKHPMKMCGCYCCNFGCKSALTVFHMVSLWPRNKVQGSVNIKEPCIITELYSANLCTSDIVSAYLPCNLCYHPGRQYCTGTGLLRVELWICRAYTKLHVYYARTITQPIQFAFKAWMMYLLCDQNQAYRVENRRKLLSWP